MVISKVGVLCDGLEGLTGGELEGVCAMWQQIYGKGLELIEVCIFDLNCNGKMVLKDA
jgi:hypothetical protein